jgi:hypothetical protein
MLPPQSVSASGVASVMGATQKQALPLDGQANTVTEGPRQLVQVQMQPLLDPAPSPGLSEQA